MSTTNKTFFFWLNKVNNIYLSLCIIIILLEYVPLFSVWRRCFIYTILTWIADENDRSESAEPGELFLHDRSDRTRSLSADSTRNESDKFNIYYEPQDFRRKMRPQTNSVQSIGGKVSIDQFLPNIKLHCWNIESFTFFFIFSGISLLIFVFVFFVLFLTFQFRWHMRAIIIIIIKKKTFEKNK